MIIKNNIKNCLLCKKTFSKPTTESLKHWNMRHKYCSRKCSMVIFQLKGQTNAVNEKRRLASLGKQHSIETKVKISGANSPSWKGGKPHCKDCGQQLQNRYAKRCLPCYWETNKGANSSNWRGGTQSLSRRIRASLKYKQWRNSVFRRDNFTCQFCGVRGTIIHADHIQPFALFPELRLDINNGRTLCISCHKSTDTYGGRTRKVLRAVSA